MSQLRHRSRRHTRGPVQTFSLHALVLLLAAISMLPFIWLVWITMTKSGEPAHFTFDNFTTLLRQTPFMRWLINSLFLASTQTVIVVLLSSLGGFALAKYRFRFKRPLMLVMLLTVLLPAQVILPSLYELMYRFGWIDSYAAILVPGAVSVFGIFLFRQAMLSVPDELLHAGRVDGCSELRLWWDIALPIVRPMLGAYTLLSFLASWNGFLWPQIILQDEAKYTLPLGLAGLVGLPGYQTDQGVLMAGTLLSILPVILLFFALQRDFLSGLSSGAIKG